MRFNYEQEKNACNIKASEAFDRFVIAKQECGLNEVNIRNNRSWKHDAFHRCCEEDTASQGRFSVLGLRFFPVQP